MADDPLTQKALEQIAFHDSESARLKRWVNDADKLGGKEPRFGNVAEGGGVTIHTGSSTMKKYSPGEFFNKAFAGAVKMIMVDRFAATNAANPATVDEIHEALVQGSFGFGPTGAEAQKNSIRISLGKNSQNFVKLAPDIFGLVEWYGMRSGKSQRKTPAKGTASPDEASGDAGADTETAKTETAEEQKLVRRL